MDGFFSSMELGLIKPPPSLVPKCGLCKLYKGCLSPKMSPDGKGKKGILIVAEAPGAEEDKRGKPLVGKTGQHLNQTLRKFGIDMRRDCTLTNAAICRPKGNKLPDKAPDHCRPNLVKTLEEVQPHVIIPLGKHAVKTLIAQVWKEEGGDKGGIGKWVGWRIPCQKPNAWICPTYHPSYCMRELEKNNPVPQRYFEDHLREAIYLTSPPWEVIPDRNTKLRIVMSEEEVETRLHRMIKRGKPIAFDYETDRLKPDHPESEIVCCAVSDGRISVAYPWTQSNAETTKRLLRSSIPKIGHNAKFEARWTLAKLGVRIRNWKWDCMVNAHIADNRSGITSLKFQSFVRMGMPDYDSSIKPFLKSKKSSSGNARNRLREHIRDNGWRPVLTYCALDALLEWELCELQMKELGISWEDL